MVDFLRDAERFIFRNRQIAEKAPLQIYNSGLVFAPEESIIKKKFKSSELPGGISTMAEPLKVQKTWGPELETLERHRGTVSSVAISPNNKLLASASGPFYNHFEAMKHPEISSFKINIWDLNTGTLQRTLEAHKSQVESMAFSRDSQLLASASPDRTVKFWDPHAYTLKYTLDNLVSPVTFVAFSTDNLTRRDSMPGRLLLASVSDEDGSDNLTKLWNSDIETQQKTKGKHEYVGDSRWVSFGGRMPQSGPDGRLELSDDRRVRLWDTVTLRSMLDGHISRVTSVAFSPDGRFALASASDGRRVKPWSLDTGIQQQTQRSFGGPVTSVAFSPNGQLLASGSLDGIVRVWNLDAGIQQHLLEAHQDEVESIAFSPDSRLLASAFRDGKVRIWNPDTDFIRPTDERGPVAFSPVGRLLAVNLGQTVKLWCWGTDTQQSILEGHNDVVRSVAFSPDGIRLASGSQDATVKLWDLNDTQKHTQWKLDYQISSVALSRDGLLVAAGSSDGTVRLWNPESDNEQQGLGKYGESVVFSSDSERLAT